MKILKLFLLSGFTCMVPLLSACIYANGPEWVRLDNGAPLVMSSILVFTFSLAAVIQCILTILDE